MKLYDLKKGNMYVIGCMIFAVLNLIFCLFDLILPISFIINSIILIVFVVINFILWVKERNRKQRKLMNEIDKKYQDEVNQIFKGGR